MNLDDFIRCIIGKEKHWHWLILKVYMPQTYSDDGTKSWSEFVMGSELQRVLSTAGVRSDMFRLGKAWFGRSISVFCYKFDMCTIHICAFIHTYIYIQYNIPSKPHWCSGWRLAISLKCKFWRVLGDKLQRITQLASIAESGRHQELLCLNSLPQKGIAGTPLPDGVWDDRWTKSGLTEKKPHPDWRFRNLCPCVETRTAKPSWGSVPTGSTEAWKTVTGLQGQAGCGKWMF